MTNDTHLALIATDLPAGGLLLGVLAIWGAAEGVVYVRNRGGSRDYRDRGSHLLLGVSSSVAVLAALQCALGLPAATVTPRVAIYCLGILVLFAGLILRFLAVASLRRFFTGDVEILAGHELVARGPYRLVRHPGYVGTFLALAGFGLALTNWASLLCLVLVLGPMGYRVRVEERALTQALGNAYRDYSARTARYFPFVAVLGVATRRQRR